MILLPVFDTLVLAILYECPSFPCLVFRSHIFEPPYRRCFFYSNLVLHWLSGRVSKNGFHWFFPIKFFCLHFKKYGPQVILLLMIIIDEPFKRCLFVMDEKKGLLVLCRLTAPPILVISSRIPVA